MRSLCVCQTCSCYYCHDSSFLNRDGTIVERKKHYCQIDDNGLEINANGFTFKEESTSQQEFVKLDCPKDCPLQLEHLLYHKQGE